MWLNPWVSKIHAVVGMIYGYPTVVPRFRQARVAHRGGGGTKPIERPSCYEDVRRPTHEAGCRIQTAQVHTRAEPAQAHLACRNHLGKQGKSDPWRARQCN